MFRLVTSFLALLSVMVMSTMISHAHNVKTGFWALTNAKGNIEFCLNLDKGKLQYSVSLNKKSLVAASRLSIVRDDVDFSDSLTFVKASPVTHHSESYSMTVGKSKTLHDQHSEQTFSFRHQSGPMLDVVVRVYEEGVAFRYQFPERENDRKIRVIDDGTSFKIAKPGKAWMLPYEGVAIWSPSYEMEWQNAIDIGTRAPTEMKGWAFPALMNTQDKWLFITEAGIDGSSFSTHLEPDPKNREYKTALPLKEETYGVAPRYATGRLPWASPWKVILVAEELAAIVESNMVYHLSAPSKIPDTSWIKPGRVSWSWWSDKSSPNDYHRLVPFVDLAADMGWEYSLVDLGWHTMQNGNIEQLIAYAEQKGVGILLWYNSGGPHNKVHPAGPEDIMHDPERRRAEMKRISQMGAKGIKVDFMQSDKQYIMQLYLDILADAAEHKLLVNFHGATLPRGFARTWPNLMTMEAVRGTEQYWDQNFADNAAMFHTIYTFTRNVVGSMDYTPVVLSTPMDMKPRQTSNAHELALAIAFESGFQHFCDAASAYRSLPDYAQRLLREVPTAWDETRFITGYPGKLSVIARRTQDRWFVSVLNGEKESKTLAIPFNFLGDGKFLLSAIVDGEDSRQTRKIENGVRAGNTLSVDLLPMGGAALILEPVEAHD